MDADYSQIELRVLAFISQDEKMLSAFRSGEDIHTKTAAEGKIFAGKMLFVGIKTYAVLFVTIKFY